MRKRKVSPGSEQDVVLLASRRGIGDVDIAERVLPSQPLVDLGHRPKIESGPLFATLAQFRKEVELLSNQRALGQFVSQFLARRRGGKAAAGKRCIFLTSVVGAAQQGQRGSIILDHVQTQATAKHGSQIERLQRVRLEVGAHVAEQPGVQIVILANSALQRVGRGRRSRPGRVEDGTEFLAVEQQPEN